METLIKDAGHGDSSLIDDLPIERFRLDGTLARVPNFLHWADRCREPACGGHIDTPIRSEAKVKNPTHRRLQGVVCRLQCRPDRNCYCAYDRPRSILVRLPVESSKGVAFWVNCISDRLSENLSCNLEDRYQTPQSLVVVVLTGHLAATQILS